MPDVTIHTDGPIVVPTESLKLQGSDGRTIKLPDSKAVALCRCGSSANKPLCDVGHKNAGFQNDPTT